MGDLFAGVFVDISLTKLDQIFTYRVLAEMADTIEVGDQVLVPFGNRKVSGTVVELTDRSDVPSDKIKDIMEIKKSSAKDAAGELIALAYFMRSHYGSTMAQALRCVFPSGKRAKPKIRKVMHLKAGEDVLSDELAKLQRRKSHSAAKERLLSELRENPDIPWNEACFKLGVTAAHIRDLEKKGIIEIEEIRSYRNPLGKITGPSGYKKVTLTDEQSRVCADMKAAYDRGERDVSLLFGVTGSGKTEVYMELIDHVVGLGQEAVFLIPEIALTYQTVMRLYKRFGDKVSIMHSRMTPGERLDQFERAKNKEISIMVGPRSALFTPFSNLGLIIMDEEHESSYKSEQPPRYHTRETAIRRARLAGASVVLGSASPSIESYSRAMAGEYKLYRLTRRPDAAALPAVETVDLREELRRGNREMISSRLARLMEETLDRGEQIMLFLNRRGMAGFVSCRSCGSVIRCPHCDVSLTLHKDGYLHCHYCGHKEIRPKVCPSCKSKYIGTMKAGTEQVEEAVQKKFPKARVIRMDADTTTGKDGHARIVEQFMNREADILVGTQMIVKGHDFPGVTLMGILLADMSLNESDYRCGERTFSLLLQACGRAGRSDLPGTALIQTYDPE
nr:primosomal protein N' [Lachnospiraceae bacterium]